MVLHFAAQPLAAVATNQVAQPMVDWTPLIPALNGILAALASVITAAVPVIVWYAVQWMRARGLKVSAEAQKELTELAERTLQKGIDYGAVKATGYVDAEVRSLKIPVSNPVVASAANYVIAQAPDTMRKLGFDPTTEAGQAAIVRMVTARLIPSPPVPRRYRGAPMDPGAKAAAGDALRAAGGKP